MLHRFESLSYGWLVGLALFFGVPALADTGDVFQLPNVGSSCGTGLGPRFEVDFDEDGTPDTLVAVFVIDGQVFVTTDSGNFNRALHFTPQFCTPDDNARFKIRFADMLDPGFDPADETTWVYKTFPALRIEGTHDLGQVAPNPAFNIFAYREIDQTDRIDPIHGTVTGGGTKVFSDSSGIKEISVRSGWSENELDNFILMATQPNTSEGSNITADLPDGSVRFPSVSVPGNTFLVEFDNGAALPAGKVGCMPKPAPPYLMVETNATTANPDVVCVDYPDTCNEAALEFLAWRTICGISGCSSSWNDLTLSIDTANNRICGDNVGFNTFFIAEPVADNDGDGVTNATDCDDSDPSVFPGAPELCDGVDNNCDGSIDDGLSTDADGDGHFIIGSCAAPADDCNDGDAGVHPGQAELCDGVDNDCSGATVDGAGEAWFAAPCDGPDADLCEEGLFSCVAGAQSCSDQTADNVETCDGLDNDCNAVTPDGSGEAWLGAACDGPDADLCIEGSYSCSNGSQFCSDTTADDIELCDGLDNDCNGATDDGLDFDLDGDTYNSLDSCNSPADCDDNNPAIWTCNTPASQDPVQVPGDGASVEFPSVSSGGDTTVTVEQCNLAQLDGLALAYPTSPCADIETTAVWDGLAEVCISYDPAEIPCTCSPAPCIAAATLSMIGCHPGQGCEVLQRTNPNECTGEICALTSHFSVFAFGTLTDVDADGTPDLLDNCPAVANFFQFDVDLDQHGDACDCAPNDATIHPGAPEINDGLDNQCSGDPGFGLIDELSGLGGFFDATDADRYSWSAQQFAVMYEVARSSGPAFVSDCLNVTVSDTFWIDPERPLAAELFHYLVRPLAPNAGSFGHDSAGIERSGLCP